MNKIKYRHVIGPLPATNIISEHEFLCSDSFSANAMICDDFSRQQKKKKVI